MPLSHIGTNLKIWLLIGDETCEHHFTPETKQAGMYFARR
jgi:hypothetical protein